VEAAIGRDGVDAVLDLAGAAYLAGNLRVLAQRGRMVVVGLIAGSSAQLDMGILLRKRLTIVGTVLRSRALEEKVALARDFTERVVPLFEAGHIKPVVDRVMSFADIRHAHEVMESNETFGKIVLRWNA
jgi:NADPH:quinone reductase